MEVSMNNSAKVEMWRNYIMAYRSSKQTAENWCKNNDLKLGKLRYWIRKFNKEETLNSQEWVAIEKDILNPLIKPISIPTIIPPIKSITIRIGKASIEVPDGFNIGTLSCILKTFGVQYD
jgi:hypothetical protein